MTMNELGTVVLRRDLPEAGLEAGDVGVIVHAHPGDSYEVEFVSGEGATLGVVILLASDLRPIDAKEILHVRSLAHS
jgi:hypothetical protein